MSFKGILMIQLRSGLSKWIYWLLGVKALHHSVLFSITQNALDVAYFYKNYTAFIEM